MAEPKRQGWKRSVTREIVKTGKIKGVFKDEIWKKDGNGVPYLDQVTDPTENLIVTAASQLLAGLMLNESTFTGGILQHAQGEGFVAWDTLLPDPTLGQTQLNVELARIAPDSIVYLDGASLPTLTITNTIQIKTTYDFLTPSALNGKFIREQGLFGGDATGTINSGFMIDAINHVKIFKDSSIRIVRFIDLTF